VSGAVVLAPHGWPAISAFVGWDLFLAEAATQGATSPKKFEAFVKAEWEPRMVVVAPPPRVGFYFDRNGNARQDPGEISRGVRVHPLIADHLAAALLEVRDADLWRFVASCAGGYTFRVMTGATDGRVSMHALGLAVDFDPAKNKRGVPLKTTALGSEPGLGVVRIFRRHGFTNGKDFPTADPMHEQFGSGY
jgi:hypothetical protein